MAHTTADTRFYVGYKRNWVPSWHWCCLNPSLCSLGAVICYSPNTTVLLTIMLRFISCSGLWLLFCFCRVGCLEYRNLGCQSRLFNFLLHVSHRADFKMIPISSSLIRSNAANRTWFPESDAVGSMKTCKDWTRDYSCVVMFVLLECTLHYHILTKIYSVISSLKKLTISYK